MGTLLYGLGLPHAPQFLTRPATEDAQQLAVIDAVYAALRRQLLEDRPDALILIANDHLENQFLDMVAPFTVVVGQNAEGHFAGHRVAVDLLPALARQFLYFALDRNFDLGFSYRFELGHAFLVPLHYLIPNGELPVLLLAVNTYIPPQPQTRRAYALGQALGDFLASVPGRYVCVASGGLSHYPGTDRYSAPDNAFDREFLAALEAGRLERVAGYTREELDAAGNLELLSWAIMAGALGPTRSTLLAYEPSWHHGYAMVRFDPRTPAPPHYAMAAPDQYEINAVLRQLMLAVEQQDRFLADPDAYLAATALTPEQRAAVKARDLTRLNALGGNPFLGFMADLNLRERQRRQPPAGGPEPPA